MSSKALGQKVGYFVFVICAFSVLLLAIYFIYLLLASSDQTRLAVLTAGVTVGTLVYTQSKNTKREIEGRQFARKAEAYEEILTTLSNVMKSARIGGQLDEEDLAERLLIIQPKLLIWAGPDVLRAWQRMATPADDPMAGLIAGNELMAAIRQELGHTSDAQLGRLGLVSTFIRADERPNRDVI